MAKVKKKKRTKKYLRKKGDVLPVYMKGLVCSWSVENPLEHSDKLQNSSIVHTNPVSRAWMDKDILNALSVHDGLKNKPYKWRVELDMEFKSAFETYFKPCVFVFYGTISTGDDTWGSALEDLFANANMAHYVTTNVKATILDDKPVMEADYDC